MKLLADILPGTTEFGIVGSVSKKVCGFTFDSRKANENTAFVAKKGTQLDGHDFIQDAITKGCLIVFCERKPEVVSDVVTYIYSSALSTLLGKVLNRFYDGRLAELKLIGVTGTNGKTTVARLLYDLFTSLGYKCGLLSTVENIIRSEVIPATHTTPDQISLFALLNEMHLKNCSHVFMEVSSHAIDQARISGLQYSCAVFTNITHDHLDYHGTFKEYLYTKKKFFDELNEEALAILNKDDVNAGVMAQNSKARQIFYSFQNISDHKARILENSLNGLHLQFDQLEWHSKLIGVFNAYNLLAVYVTAISLGEQKSEVLQKMSLLNPVEGRFEYMVNQQTGKNAIIDYAHTPDALQKIINTILEIKKNEQQLITVVGCGGDRDKLKRPIMAKIACMLSDKVIFTSDNPRGEEPSEIIKEMIEGVEEKYVERYLIIEDRQQAIKTACLLAAKNDIILVAGKGHEKYQEIKGKKLPFDDKKLINTFL